MNPSSPSGLSRQDAPKPKCPTCGKTLEHITYPGGYLNRDQWESIRAGEWWCETCPRNGRGTKGAYYWNREVVDVGEARSQSPASTEASATPPMSATSGASSSSGTTATEADVPPFTRADAERIRECGDDLIHCGSPVGGYYLRSIASRLAVSLDAKAAESSTEATLRAELEHAATVFEEYARMHDAKGTEDGFAKADRNRAHAQRCRLASRVDPTPEGGWMEDDIAYATGSPPVPAEAPSEDTADAARQRCASCGTEWTARESLPCPTCTTNRSAANAP